MNRSNPAEDFSQIKKQLRELTVKFQFHSLLRQKG